MAHLSASVLASIHLHQHCCYVCLQEASWHICWNVFLVQSSKPLIGYKSCCVPLFLCPQISFSFEQPIQSTSALICCCVFAVQTSYNRFLGWQWPLFPVLLPSALNGPCHISQVNNLLIMTHWKGKNHFWLVCLFLCHHFRGRWGGTVVRFTPCLLWAIFGSSLWTEIFALWGSEACCHSITNVASSSTQQTRENSWVCQANVITKQGCAGR